MATNATYGMLSPISVTQRPLANDPNGTNGNVTKLTATLKREKATKRKIYSYLVKIADELKTLRNKSKQLINAPEYARKAWHKGGMWRGPNILPSAATLNNSKGGGRRVRVGVCWGWEDR